VGNSFAFEGKPLTLVSGGGSKKQKIRLVVSFINAFLRNSLY
jgi:hypothetical protein